MIRIASVFCNSQNFILEDITLSEDGMLLTKCVRYLGVVRQLWESEGMITSPTQEEGKDTRYEIKCFEIDIGVLLLIGRLGASPHPKAYRLTKC
jgi:hypothetical protein